MTPIPPPTPMATPMVTATPTAAASADRPFHRRTGRAGAWRRAAALASVLVTALVVSACGGGGGGDAAAAAAAAGGTGGTTTGSGTGTGTGTGIGTGTTGSTALYTLAVAATPLQATLTVDDARAASADLGLAGGSLTVTGADGVVYRLDVPANALATPVTVRMAPLTSAQGLPPGQTGAGVQLSPDGLQFLNPVTLTMTPPAGTRWAVDQQLALSLTGSSNTVSLTDLSTTSAVPVFPLTHFSSYVLLLSEKGIDASLRDVRQQLGGQAEQRLQSAVAEAAMRERQAQLLGSGGNSAEYTAQVLALMEAFDTQVLKPRLAAAGSSCAAARLAQQTLFGYQRQRDLLGLGSDPRLADALNGGLADTVALTCLREEYEICRDQHIVTRILPVFLGVMRQAELLGLVSETGMPTRLVQAEDYVRRCLNFEVQLDSDMSYTRDAPNHTVTETVSGRFALGYQLDLTRLPADRPAATTGTLALIGMTGPLATLASTAYRVSYPGLCDQVSGVTSVAGALGASFLGLLPGANTPQTPGGANTVRDVQLSLVVGPDLRTADVSHYTLRSATADSAGRCGAPVTTSAVGEGWLSQAAPALEAQLSTPDAGLLVDRWQVVGNADLMATKDLNVDVSPLGNDRTRANLHLFLFHKPLP